MDFTSCYASCNTFFAMRKIASSQPPRKNSLTLIFVRNDEWAKIQPRIRKMHAKFKQIHKFFSKIHKLYKFFPNFHSTQSIQIDKNSTLKEQKWKNYLLPLYLRLVRVWRWRMKPTNLNKPSNSRLKVKKRRTKKPKKLAKSKKKGIKSGAISKQNTTIERQMSDLC